LLARTPAGAYERLSFLDNWFLLMETPTSPMHIAGIATFEAGPLETSDGGIDIDKIRDYVASRLHLIPHRRLDWLAMDLADVKGVKSRLGGTLNDAVLATIAGALWRYLLRRGVDVAALDFRVMAPVSVRTEQQNGTLGNQISAWMVPMPLGERDPTRRFDKIRETTERLKHSKRALGVGKLNGVGEWIPSALRSLGARLAVRVLPFNLVVTNVPGPRQSLYMLGGRMVDNFGFIPLVDSLCLGVVLFSYAGKLCWGFTADWDLMPDLHDFVGDIEKSFGELRDAPEQSAARTVAPKVARRPQRRRRPAAARIA
jgi:WS/DGAT/MGAT family acyltransferase